MVVVLADIRFYGWMYWTNPFQYSINGMTSISVYYNAKECQSDCMHPQLPDGPFVWARLATERSLSYERIDKDILI